MPRRTPARRPRAARSWPPASLAPPRARPPRRGRARARPTRRPGSPGRRVRRRPPGRSRAAARASGAARARSGRRWSRSCTATIAPTLRRAARQRRATRAAASPAARRRRRAPSRASGSSARGARLGAARRDRRSRGRRRRRGGQRCSDHHQGVAGRVAEPEHRRHRVAHPRDLGVDVDAERLQLRVRRVDVVGGQRDAGLRRPTRSPGGGGASAIPVVPSGG